MRKVTITRKNRTGFLLPNVGFLIGMGSIFNIAGNYFIFNTSKTDEEADCKALKSDWDNIGEDFEEALEALKVPEII